jgi:hypothetical protein
MDPSNYESKHVTRWSRDVYIQNIAYLPNERIEEDPSSSMPVHLFPLPPTQGWNYVIISQWKTEKIFPKFETGP